MAVGEIYGGKVKDNEKRVERRMKTDVEEYLKSLRIKRRRQQLEDILLAIILNKNENDGIIEAVENSSANSETKKELIEWLNTAGIKKKD